jgi:hypothetical protein
MITQLYNFGIQKVRIENFLLERLKQECEEAENNSKFISSLTGNGVPQHYYVEKNLEMLNDVVMSNFIDYNNAFNILQSYSYLTDDVNVISDKPWINVQRKGEFIPNHRHEGIVSWVIWVSIPYDINKELTYGQNRASTFEFTYPDITGGINHDRIEIDKSMEGTLMMFPAGLTHCVYPFYTSEQPRFSISGNIYFNTKTTH